MRVKRVRTFVLPSVVINAGRFFRRSTWAAALALKHVNDILLRAGHLGLREVGEQMLVPAVAVHNDHFLAAIARHFVRSFLQKFQLKLSAVGDRSRLVLGLKNLPEIIFWKNYSKFLLGGMES